MMSLNSQDFFLFLFIMIYNDVGSEKDKICFHSLFIMGPLTLHKKGEGDGEFGFRIDFFYNDVGSDKDKIRIIH